MSSSNAYGLGESWQRSTEVVFCALRFIKKGVCGRVAPLERR